MIGVSFGAPTEFKSNGKIDRRRIAALDAGAGFNSLEQDDLYVDMTFAKVLDDKGINATTEDFGAMFRNAKYQLWHANLAARRESAARRSGRALRHAANTTLTPTISTSRSRPTSSD